MKIVDGSGFAWRRPEYTGANRCLPCTAVNLCITAALALGVGAIRPVLGVAVAVVGVAAIYFRGYLIPGTPTLTTRYLPDRVLALFDHGPAAAAFDADGGGAVDIERFLVRAGALERCRDDEDLCLTPEFRAAWDARLQSLASAADVPLEPLFSGLDADIDAVELEARPNAFAAATDDKLLGRWESETAFLADAAADAALADRVANWREVPYRSRTEVLGALRLWLDHCPDCGGLISLDEELVESCCRSIETVATTCDDCGTRLFEAQLPPGGVGERPGSSA